MKKSIAFLSFLLFFTPFLQAEKWHVCLGSFSARERADIYKEELKTAGYPAFIEETEVKSKKFFRVLLEEEFENPEEARKQCREFEANTFSLRRRLKGLWIVSTAAEIAIEEEIPVAVPLEEEETKEADAPLKDSAEAIKADSVLLEKNSELPVSEEKPYSVFIQTYKEEQAAENDRQRLAEKDVDAYVLKKLDKKEAIKFDLQAGAFETAEEALVLEEKLEAMNLPDLQVTNYNDYADEVSEFDDVITQREIVFDSGNNEIPDSIPRSIQVSLNQFPVNENFQIKAVKLYDLNNMKKNNCTEGADFAEENMPASLAENTSALSYAEYFDDLYKKQVSVLVAVNEDGSYENFIGEEQKDFIVTETDFMLPYGKLHSFISGDESFYLIQGITEDKKMYVQMVMPGFTKEEMISFVENSYSDSSLLFYPQIRKSLCIIPDKNGEDDSFLWFDFNKVDDSYAEIKGYADWAYRIVGHWKSTFHILENKEIISAALFDLDYDYNAREVHAMFMDEKNGINIDSNHYLEVKDCDGWYVETYDGNEVSFSRKSYIIAVDSDFYSGIKEEELKSLAEQLKIWQ